MNITSIGAAGANASDSTAQPSAAETASADSRFQDLIDEGDDAKETLAEITKGGAAGYWAWEVKQMQEQATAQVMGSMNLTPDKIASMDTKTRVATEEKIEQLVEQKVKQEIADDSKKKQQQALVTSASMTSILTNAQSIREKLETHKGTTVVAANPADPTDMLLFGAS